jgi:hypothetical protein
MVLRSVEYTVIVAPTLQNSIRSKFCYYTFLYVCWNDLCKPKRCHAIILARCRYSKVVVTPMATCQVQPGRACLRTKLIRLMLMLFLVGLLLALLRLFRCISNTQPRIFFDPS